MAALAALCSSGPALSLAQKPAPRRVETVPARPIGEPAAPSTSPSTATSPAGPAAPAPAADRGNRPKLAVLVLKTDNVADELADNLTEVLIAALARRPESFD